MLYPNCTRNHAITYTNNLVMFSIDFQPEQWQGYKASRKNDCDSSDEDDLPLVEIAKKYSKKMRKSGRCKS